MDREEFVSPVNGLHLKKFIDGHLCLYVRKDGCKMLDTLLIDFWKSLDREEFISPANGSHLKKVKQSFADFSPRGLWHIRDMNVHVHVHIEVFLLFVDSLLKGNDFLILLLSILGANDVVSLFVSEIYLSFVRRTMKSRANNKSRAYLFCLILS